jgi:hypothetical protein
MLSYVDPITESRCHIQQLVSEAEHVRSPNPGLTRSDSKHADGRTRLRTVLVIAAAGLLCFGDAGVTAAASNMDTPLAAPTLTAPSSPSNNANPQWSFSGPVGATFECWFGPANGQVTKDPCTSPRRYDLTAAGDGAYSFGVRYHDSNRNTSAWASSTFVLYRQPSGTPPPATIPGNPTLVSSPDTFSSDSTPTWTFTGEPGATFNCTLVQPFEGMWDGGPTGGDPPPDPVLVDSGQCSSGVYTFDLGAYPDHGYTLSITQTVANATSAALVDSYRLDRIAYTPIFSATPYAVSSDPTPVWTFYAYGEVFPVLITCTLGRNGSATPEYSGPCGPETFTFDLGPYPDDTYTLSAVLTDQAGNISRPATDSFVVDRTIPNAPPTATFTFSCSALTCNFDGSGSADIDGTIVFYTWDYGDGTVQGGGGTCPCWKYGWHAYNTSGSYTVKLTVRDNAEATGSVSKQVSVLSTATPPPTPTPTPSNTPTLPPTPAPTNSQTPTPTVTPPSAVSPTPTPTLKATPTPTFAPSPPPSPTKSPTLARTPIKKPHGATPSPTP